MDQPTDPLATGRIHLSAAPPIRLGPLTISPALHVIAHDDGRSDVLEPRVMQVLVALIGADGGVVTRDELIERCWNGRIVGDDAIIRTISRLRRTADDLGKDVFRIETITKAGYRLIREDRTDGSEGGPPAAADAPMPLVGQVPSRTAPSPAGWRKHWRVAVLAALLAFVIVLAGLLWWRSGREANGRLLMVEALATSPTDQKAGLLRQSLANDLSRVVVDSDTTLQFVDPGDKGATPRKADFSVSGEAQTVDKTLNATVRLIDNRSSTILWSRDFSGPSAEVEALRQRMAIRIAEVLVCALGARAKRPADIDLATLRLFLAGCENLHTDWPAAWRYFGQVVARRPDFTRARAMYAESIVLNTGTFDNLTPEMRRRYFQQAEEQARRAIKEDPHAGDAYDALASSLYGFKSWAPPNGADNWMNWIALLERGHAADPDSFALTSGLMVKLGDVGINHEAASLGERAAALDPFAPIGTSNLAEFEAYSGRLAEAQRLLDQAKRYWPDEFYTSWLRFEVAARVGDPAQALAMLDNFDNNPGYKPPRADLWRLFLQARREPSPAHVEQAARTFLTAAPALDTQGKIEMVQHLVQLGKRDEAYAISMAMPSVVEEWGFIWFRDYMAPFRADPRFLDFARRQGLYDIWVRSKRWPDFCDTDKLPYRCR